MSQPFLVEFESSTTGGETSHKDVDADLHGIFILDVFVDHFNHFIVHDARSLKFLSVIVQPGVQSGGGENGFDFTLVALLTVLAPETVEHHFG